MSQMPDSQHSTAQKIYDWYTKKSRPYRPHLGASVIGHSCDRYLWLTFRWAKQTDFPGRILRLFETGNLEEIRIAKELKGIGVVLHTHDEKGSQIRCFDKSGHFGGSVDGVAKGFPEALKTWAVLEAKTHNSKSFKQLEKKGVLESKPRHYAQMQVYMGLMDLTRAMYFAVNKDTDDIYTEWVKFDTTAFSRLSQRAEKIISATEPPLRVSESADWWECRFCDFKTLCHGEEVAEANCRTCCHSTPVAEGQWQCGKFDTDINAATQEIGCQEHIYIPPLIPYAEPVDASDDWVEYEHKETKKTFKNGSANFRSTELQKMPPDSLGEGTVAEIKDAFPGAEVTRIVSTAGGDIKKIKKAPKRKKRVVSQDAIIDDEIPF